MQTLMKAMLLTEAQTPLKLVNVPKPVIQPHEVLVKVMASGTNPLDLKIKAGRAPHAKHPLPAVLGMDMAGVVVEVGSAVNTFSFGERVFGLTGGVGGVQGSLAEYQAVDASLLAALPDNCSFEDASVLPLIFITAWEGLVDRAKVSFGQKVLVHGGAGGVGHVAIQIAKAYGAEVFATCSHKDSEFVRSLGAEPIDYTHQSLEDYVGSYTQGNGFDIVYDTVGGEVLDQAFKAVKQYSGHVLSCLGWGSHSLAPLSFKSATYSGVFTLVPLQENSGRSNHGFIVSQASSMLLRGLLKVRRDLRVFDLERSEDAHEYLSQKMNCGKVCIVMPANR